MCRHAWQARESSTCSLWRDSHIFGPTLAPMGHTNTFVAKRPTPIISNHVDESRNAGHFPKKERTCQTSTQFELGAARGFSTWLSPLKLRGQKVLCKFCPTLKVGMDIVQRGPMKDFQTTLHSVWVITDCDGLLFHCCWGFRPMRCN